MSEVATPPASDRCTRVAADHPEQFLEHALAEFAAAIIAPTGGVLHAVDFKLLEYWRDEATPVALVALYHLQRCGSATVIDAAVVESSVLTDAIWRELQEQLHTEPRTVFAPLQKLHIPCFNLDEPLRLQPISIPKPWGREIWYTGIERRGVAEVSDGRFTVALPWLLALAPRRLLGAARQPILLKILDPLPEAVFGDLYFEMHQQKQEVYVVTAIDAQAWPDGTGAIRFGFNAELRAQYGDDQKFLDGYLKAVRAYREQRTAIDRQLDERRELEGIALDAPLAAATLQSWLSELPAPLRQREQELRGAMERYTGMRDLRIGDVVKVPCLVPHSLQHGVRTVEFQTPVYERLILSFAQKVLTQVEWDTEAAAQLLRMDPPPAEPWHITARGEGWTEERIVEFDDFEVRRITMQGGAARAMGAIGNYALVMAVGSGLQLQGAALPADAAVLLPATWGGGEIVNRDRHPAYVLFAAPYSPQG